MKSQNVKQTLGDLRPGELYRISTGAMDSLRGEPVMLLRVIPEGKDSLCGLCQIATPALSAVLAQNYYDPSNLEPLVDEVERATLIHLLYADLQPNPKAPLKGLLGLDRELPWDQIRRLMADEPCTKSEVTITQLTWKSDFLVDPPPTDPSPDYVPYLYLFANLYRERQLAEGPWRQRESWQVFLYPDRPPTFTLLDSNNRGPVRPDPEEVKYVPNILLTELPFKLSTVSMILGEATGSELWPRRATGY